MPEEIILIGGGGHCRSVIDVIESTGKFRILGIIDQENNKGQIINGYPIIGSDDDLPTLMQTCKNFCVTVGQIKSGETRNKIYTKVKSLGGLFPTIVSPHAHVSANGEIGEGTVVHHKVVVNANAVIGANCIINTASLVEHGAVVQYNTHVSTGAIVNGDVTVGEHCFIGSGAVLVQGVTVGNHVVVGAGTVVLKDLDSSTLYVGNPAKRKR